MGIPKFYISDLDPKTSAEGTLDPLGLAPLADRLAQKLAPGVRERQKHPRFLTSVVAGLSLFDEIGRRVDWNEQKVDRWEVFEWLVVSALIKVNKDDPKMTAGLPGVEKAKQSFNRKLPLCAERYLKTPGTFGFHGIYKVLATEIGFEAQNYLGEAGASLLQVWIDEQGLKGFNGTTIGPGTKLKNNLINGIVNGLKAGEVCEPWSWPAWDAINQHLNHLKPGAAEAKFIHQAIAGKQSGLRFELLQFLGSKDFDQLGTANGISESMVHRALLKNGSKPMRELLHAVSKYEAFARLLTAAFTDIRFELSSAGHALPVSKLAEVPAVKAVSKDSKRVFQEALEAVSQFGEGPHFSILFQDFENSRTPQETVEVLLAHHDLVQRKKPPAGKRSWFEKLASGHIMLRPDYHADRKFKEDVEYIHFYRTWAIRGFLKDLGVITNG